MRDRDGKPELRWIHLDESLRARDELPIAEEPYPPRPRSEVVDLISSVRLHGVLCPILVREHEGKYQIVCGYRRYLAAREAGSPAIPAVVRPLEDSEAIRCYLSAKLLRKALPQDHQASALELLHGLRKAESTRSPAGPRSLENRLPPSRRAGICIPAATVEERDEVDAAADGGAAPESRLESLGPPSRRWIGFDADSAVADGGRTDEWMGRISEILTRIRETRRIEAVPVDRLVDEILDLSGEPGGFDLRRIRERSATDPLSAHSILSAILCERIAAPIGWTGDTRRDFVVAGLLHDVGMVFVRHARLDQPRSLTDPERAEVQSHTRIGCALVAGARAWSEQVSICTRDHHERWDGSGYPAGRSGPDVLFPARLLGLLDTYAALLATRPHRNALQPQSALERLSRALELGLFDPSFVFLVRGPLREALTPPLEPAGDPADASPGNPVALPEPVATMLSKDSG